VEISGFLASPNDDMFQGSTALTLDAKGRLAIPTKHRELMNGQSQGKLVLTGHPDGCLLLYQSPTFDEVRSRLMAVSDTNSRVASWKRVIVGMAENIEADAQGRMLITPELRKYAGMEKQLMMVGQGNRFEVWSESAWNQQLEQIRAQSGQTMPQAMESFTL
jgi:MraZ protein